MPENSNYNDISILTVPYIETTPTQQQQLVDLFSLLVESTTNYMSTPSIPNEQSLAHVLSDLYFVLIQNFPDASNYLIYLLNEIVEILINANYNSQSQVVNQLQSIYDSLSILVSELILPVEIRNTLNQNLSTLVSITFLSISNQPLEELLYVVNQDNFLVSAVDSHNNFVVGTINLEVAPYYYPYGIAINNSTNLMYTVNNYSPSILSVIDTTTNTFVTTVTLARNYAKNIAINESANEVYITTSTNTNPGFVTVINTLTNTPVGTDITVGYTPEDIAYDPISNLIYVTNAGTGTLSTVSIINAATKGVIENFLLTFNTPFGIAVKPIDANTSYIYVGHNISPGKVTVIRRTGLGINLTHTIEKVIDVGQYVHGVTVNSVLNEIYVANYGDSRVSVIEGTNNSVVATLTVGSNPWNIAVNEKNQFFYVTNYGSANISVIKNLNPGQLPYQYKNVGRITVASHPIGIDIT